MKYTFLILLLWFGCKNIPYSGSDIYKDEAIWPKDEGVHYKNSLEWWYFTGHLKDKGSANEYGVEYVFFHFTPRGKEDYLMVNIAVTDPQNKKFYYDYKIEKMKSLLGFELPVDLSIEDKNNFWKFYGQQGEFLLKAIMQKNDFGLDLKTKPIKPVLLHNNTGYEQYGNYASAGYISYTRLKVDGYLTLEDEVVEVEGQLWYDRQWNCIGVYQKKVAWDWFSIQFEEEQEELMIYQLYNVMDSTTLYGGVYYTKDNKQIDIKKAELIPLEYWRSPSSKINYPIKWQVKVPNLNIDVIISAVMPDQEIKIKFGPITALYYWEGMCKAEGTKDGKPVKGNSYIEMTNRGIR